MLFGKLFFLLLQHYLMLELDINKDKQQGKRHSDIDDGDPTVEHLRRAASKRYKDIKQEEYDLPPFQSPAAVNKRQQYRGANCEIQNRGPRW